MASTPCEASKAYDATLNIRANRQGNEKEFALGNCRQRCLHWGTRWNLPPLPHTHTRATCSRHVQSAGVFVGDEYEGDENKGDAKVVVNVWSAPRLSLFLKILLMF